MKPVPVTKSNRKKSLDRRVATPGATSGGFPIVAIGASAGGLKAFKELLGHLPKDSGMAFVLVQHLTAEGESRLAERLMTSAKIPVTEAKETRRVQPNRIYVIPPGRNMAISNGILRLQPPASGAKRHFPIDHFFASLAEDRKGKSIGVILSGSTFDGAQGLKAIKAQGGFTFAQDNTAEFVKMPKHAIAAGFVDYILPPREIARELGRIARHPHVAPIASTAETDLSSVDQDLRKIINWLRTPDAIEFSQYKKTTILGTARRRMVLTNTPSMSDYLRRLKDDRAELNALYRDVRVSAPGFFREPGIFELLQQEVLPKLIIGRRPEAPLRIWVPACSTGEEAYSIAICALECMEVSKIKVGLQVFATDINDLDIRKARSGEYTQAEVSEVSPERLNSFFRKTELGFEIDRVVRGACTFARHNLIGDPPYAHLDLITCRNLVICREPQLETRLMPLFHYALQPHGFLVLGSSEGPSNFTDHFAAVGGNGRILAKRSSGRGKKRFSPLLEWPSQRKQDDEIGGLGNEDLAAANDEIQCSNEELQAINEEMKTTREDLLATNEKLREANGQLRRLRQDVTASMDDLNNVLANVTVPMLILGHDLSVRRFNSEMAATLHLIPADCGRPVSDLRLAAGFAGLLDLVKECIESRTAQNREVQNRDGRWQSLRVCPYRTNDDRIDGVVVTLVDLTEAKVEALEARAYSEAIGQRGREAVLVLDPELTVKTANRAFYEIFQTSPDGTLGLRFQDLGNGEWNIPRLVGLLRHVLPRQAEIKQFQLARDFPKVGRRLLEFNACRIFAEHATPPLILLTIEDITERPRLVDLQEQQSTLIELAHDAIIVRDPNSAVRMWNQGATALYGWTKDEAAGKITHDLFKTRFPEPLEEVERKLKERGEWAGELVHTARDGSQITVTSHHVVQRNSEGNVVAILEINRDVTEQKRAEAALRSSEARLRALLNSIDDIVFEVDESGRCLGAWTGTPLTLAKPEDEPQIFRAEDLLPLQSSGPLREAFDRVRQTKKAENVEYSLELLGETRWFLARINRIVSHDKSSINLSVLVRDITARRTAEIALEESEERFRLLVEGVKDYAIYALDTEGRITSWNSGAERIKGYRREEVLGRHFSLFYLPEDVSAGMPARALQAAAAEGRFEDVGSWRVRKDGSRFYANALVTAMRDQFGNLRGFSKVTRDITDQMRAEEAVRQLSGHILRLQDEERRRIARDLHDSTAQVLSALSLNLSVMARRPGLARDAQAVKLLRESEMLAKQAGAEIRSTSHLLHPPDLDAVGLVAAIRWYAARFSERSGISARLSVPDDLSRLPQDSEIALFRVVQESLANVQRHSGSKTVRIRIAQAQDVVDLQIEDKGHGIPLDILAQKQHSIDRLGVGIAGMRERLRQVGGRLTIVSNSRGTKVKAVVPLPGEPDAKAHEP
jgi:two-component system CheB/CheR fusion protein